MDVLSFSTIADHIKKEINDDCGLNLSQTRILLYFDNTKNQSLTMGKLAKDLHISLSTLSRQLQQKQTRDFVDIIRAKKSSSKIVSLNEKGISKVKELKATLSSIEMQLFAGFSAKELKQFSNEIKAIIKEYSSLA